MSFRIKSALAMAVVMAATGTFYLFSVVEASRAIGHTAPPAVAVAYVLAVIVVSIIVQTALALIWPRDANARADERERAMQTTAGNWAGWVLSVGAVGALGHYWVNGDGNMLFHLVLASLIVAQTAEYASQIFLDRTRL